MKKFINKVKRGFTLTELAIVIAVIAILIAVLVPTFIALIDKAKESTDSQLAKNMNTLLATAETDGDKPERMEDVNKILVDGGYTIAKLTPSANGNIFVWNEETNRISYVSTEDWTVIYAGDSTLTADEVFTRTNNYWVTVESVDEIKSWSGLSYYFGKTLTDNVTFTEGTDSSIDTGTYKLTGTLTYGTSTASSQSTKTSVNSVKTGKSAAGTNTTTGTATLRGTIEELEVNSSSIAVTNYSSITNETTITNASAYTESGYSVSLIVNSSSAKVTIANNGVVGKISTTNGVTLTDVVTNNGYIVNTNSSNLSQSSSGYSYEISSYTELANFRDKVNNGATFAGVIVTLTANIDISGRSWVPIGYDNRDNAKNGSYRNFAGTFNGNGKTISGLSNSGFTPTTIRTDTYGNAINKENYCFGLFGIINGATITDLNMTNVNIYEDSELYLDSVGAIAGFASNGCTISNCIVSGSIKATDAAGGILGRAYPYSEKQTVKVENCVNNCTITTTGDKAAGIVGFFDNTRGSNSTGSTIEITNCTNNGAITSKSYVAGISVAENSNCYKAYTVSDCVNTGKLSVTAASGTSLGYIVGRGGTGTANDEGNTWTITDCSSTFTTTASAANVVWDENGTIIKQES